jgi:HSP20 family protein
MATLPLAKPGFMPTVFEDFFKPWSQWLDGGGLISKIYTAPAVNITANPNHYTVSLAAPGLKKEDFRIEVEDNMITISSEKEEKKEDKEEKYSRKEYSYSSFSRSFSLPEDVKMEAIEVRYEDGVLRINIPRKEDARKSAVSKKIAVK